jgi:hypothetical protein
VDPLLHQADDRCEAGKVAGLGGSQWVCFEKRNDAIRKIHQTSDMKAPDVFTVVVVSAIDIDRPASKEVLQLVQYMHTPKSLHDRELGLNLPAESARSILENRNAEAPLAVDEADDPLHSLWPFLLIVRTGRIVTSHAISLKTGCDRHGW